MFPTGAFNALLKTLEEPPAHVKFILATTEIDKVPETIRSRALEFDFKKITETDIITRLEFVTKAEEIKAEKEALSIIAKAARGGLRDALTFEQNTINAEVSTEYVRSTLSLWKNLSSKISSMHSTMKTERDFFRSLSTSWCDMSEYAVFSDQMLYTLRDKLFENLEHRDFGIYDSIFAIFEKGYSSIKSIPDGFFLIEITLLRAVNRGNEKKSPQLQKRNRYKANTKRRRSKNNQKLRKHPKLKKQHQKSRSQNHRTTRRKNRTNNQFFVSKISASTQRKKPALVAELKMARFKHE